MYYFYSWNNYPEFPQKTPDDFIDMILRKNIDVDKLSKEDFKYCVWNLRYLSGSKLKEPKNKGSDHIREICISAREHIKTTKLKTNTAIESVVSLQNFKDYDKAELLIHLIKTSPGRLISNIKSHFISVNTQRRLRKIKSHIPVNTRKRLSKLKRLFIKTGLFKKFRS